MTQNEAAQRLPYLKRRYMITGGCFVAGIGVWACALLILAFFGDHTGSGGPPSLTIQSMRFAFAPPLLLAATAAVVNYRWRRRIRKLASSVGCRMCPRCCYNLTAAQETPGTVGEVKCPECGEQVNLAEVERLWRAWSA